LKLVRPFTAVLGVPGHQQGLQLLGCIGGVLVDLLEAVVSVAADLLGQGRQQMVIFRGRLGNVANPEFVFDLAKPGGRVVWPEVGNLECHVGHELVSLSSFAAIFYVHKGVGPRSRQHSRAGKSVCKGGEYPLPLYVLRFIFENMHVGADNLL
jgi:hypothetical protein